MCACLLTGCGSDDDVPHAPAPAREAGTVDVGGRKMYLECRGTGTPTVVLETGLGSPRPGRGQQVHGPLAQTTRTCAYDRAGIGGSEPGEPPRTSAAMVEELRALLAAGDVPPPHVLVGASFGGLNAQLMVRQHRTRSPGSCCSTRSIPISTLASRRSWDAARRATARRWSSRTREGVRFEDQLARRAAIVAAEPLPLIPLPVLVHGVSFEPGGERVPKLERALQRDLASQSPQGALEMVPRSHHRIAEDAPDRVAAAVRAVVVAARAATGG